MITAEGPELIERGGNSTVGVIDPPTEASSEIVPTARPEPDDKFPIGREPQIGPGVDEGQSVNRVCIRPCSEVLPVQETHRRLGAVTNEHVASAGVEPVECATEGLDGRSIGGSEVDGVCPCAVLLQRDLVNTRSSVVIVGI